MPLGGKTRRHRASRQRTWRRHRGGGEIPKLPGVPICHPKFKSRTTKQCLSGDVLRQIAASVGNPRESLAKALGCKEGDEVCLVKQSKLPEEQKREIESAYFRPKMPKEWNQNINTWLSDADITIVMKQYQEAYPEFRFLEVSPIDFSAPDPNEKDEQKCIVESFCNLNLGEMKSKGKTKIGAILNLDPHYKGGSHWVGLFIDLDKKEVNYFDSYGMQPPKQIARFMRSLTLQDSSLKLQSNGRRFQYKGSECGVYSMVFVISMLAGFPFKRFVKKPIADDAVQQFRHFFYRTNA